MAEVKTPYTDLFSYDAGSGQLFWKERPLSSFTGKTESSIRNACGSWNTKYAGKEAGTLARQSPTRGVVNRAILVWMKGVSMEAHRIIWEISYGPIPDGMFIDHINRNPIDNRLSNLRLATQSENARNCTLYKSSTTRLKGVSFFKQSAKWKATIGINNKHIHLGLFQTKGLAAVAYAKASIRYHGAYSTFCPAGKWN